MATHNFPLYYQFLRDSVSLNYETGYVYHDPYSANTTYEVIPHIAGVLGISFNPATHIDGFVHTHFNNSDRLSVFSADDFISVYRWISDDGGLVTPKTFTFGMVTDSTSYIMMIENPAKFLAFCQLRMDLTTDDNDLFKRSFYDSYKINANNSIAQNEKGFLNAIKKMDCGLKNI